MKDEEMNHFSAVDSVNVCVKQTGRVDIYRMDGWKIQFTIKKEQLYLKKIMQSHKITAFGNILTNKKISTITLNK